jgi:signal transduction histidine kinase
VLSNLITNALDACSPGGRLEIRAQARRDESGEGAEITVIDNGDGIAAEVLPRVFEPFFTTKKDVGTGLGLWVVKQIVEGSSGTLDIESSTAPDSHGTTVKLFLPEIAGVNAQGASPSTPVV